MLSLAPYLSVIVMGCMIKFKIKTVGLVLFFFPLFADANSELTCFLKNSVPNGALLSAVLDPAGVIISDVFFIAPDAAQGFLIERNYLQTFENNENILVMAQSFRFRLEYDWKKKEGTMSVYSGLNGVGPFQREPVECNITSLIPKKNEAEKDLESWSR